MTFGKHHVQPRWLDATKASIVFNYPKEIYALKIFQITSSKKILAATGANLLDTKYEFYGFSDDLKDTIN